MVKLLLPLKEILMIIRGTLKLFGAVAMVMAVILAFVSAQAGQADSQPNFVIVVVDDMRWDDYGAGGHAFVKTPNIDRIAKEGVRFTNAFTTTPLCSPARASLLTGMSAHHHGIIDNTQRGGHKLDTFPRRLHDAGYDTGFVGKWHMGNDGTPRPGFNTWVSMLGQGSNTDPELNVDGERLKFTGHITDVLTDQAVSFLKAKHDKPFLLYLAHKAVHPDINMGLGDRGFIAAKRHLGIYDDESIMRRPSAGVPPLDKPVLMRKILGLPPLGHDTATKDETIRDRLEMVTGVDDSVGRLLDTLEHTGQLQNTVFIFTSDHGYFYGEHGLSPQRRFAYEEAIRIPLLIRYPSMIKAGSVPDHMVLNIDLAPTVIDLAGVKLSEMMNGRSLVPILSGRTVNKWRSSFLIEHHTDPDSYVLNAPANTPQELEFRRVLGIGYKAVRDLRYKYIEYSELRGMNELYDLDKDPYEMINLIDSPESNNMLQEMKTKLRRLLKEI
jgi:N-acetylglucosamine-6-sulfatase